MIDDELSQFPGIFSARGALISDVLTRQTRTGVTKGYSTRSIAQDEKRFRNKLRVLRRGCHAAVDGPF